MSSFHPMIQNMVAPGGSSSRTSLSQSRDDICSNNFNNGPRAHRRNNSMVTSKLNQAPAYSTADLEATPIKNRFDASKKPGPVTWLSLPRKNQLAILFMCRLVDFLQVASLQAYMFYQLRSFDPTLSDATISSQAGILQGCFTASQVLTAILWGKVADASWGGRKIVLLIGLAGTGVSCLGYGFATTFWQAAFFRILGGGINGLVGIIRTMIAEITVEKKFQSRAFLILPMSFNVAVLIGPVLGGLLSDPAVSHPDLFGTNAIFGFQWMQTFPYALPSVLNAIFLFIVFGFVFFGLEETLKSRKHKFDPGLFIAKVVTDFLTFRKSNWEYKSLDSDMTLNTPETVEFTDFNATEKPIQKSRKLPFSRIWTKNVIFTLLTSAFFDFHMGAFNNLWSLFLSSPRYLPPTDTLTSRLFSRSEEVIRSLPFNFTGGLGMPASSVGFATAIIGGLGMFLQLVLYPAIHSRLGTLRCFRLFLVLFPFAYFLAPYLAVLPSSTEAPEQASGGWIWFGISLVLLLQVMARTFALPATIILLNNCSPHPSVLGTVHGIGQSVSSAFRTIGPIVGGIWYGQGLEMGVVGLAWWGIAAVSAAGCVAALFVYEGSGHEIFLEGELEMIEEENTPEDEALLRASGRGLSLDTLVEDVDGASRTMAGGIMKSPVDIQEKRRERGASIKSPVDIEEKRRERRAS